MALIQGLNQTLLKKLILVSIFLFSQSSSSLTLTEDLSSRNYFSSSSGQLIANQALGILHPPLQVTSYQTVCDGSASNLNVDFGDGSHGAFDSSTYSKFGTITGSGPYTITINTDSFPVINATDFTLDSNYTLTATGSGPLVIKALRDVTLNGIIDCAGAAGSNAILGTANLASGGTAKCGGGVGGNGGTSTTNATSGSRGISTVLTGGAGATGAVGAGGAGGSGHNWTSACGTPGIAATSGLGVGGGVAVGNYEDSAIRLLGGGAGGGGGARGATYSGAGGGAGGGHVEIYALRDLTISASSQILVKGGNGGTSAGDSGGGGGGASGTVKVIVGRTSTIAVGGLSPMTNGAGGTSGTGSAGGNGAKGRIWIVDKNGENCFAGECDTSQNSGITAVAGTVEYKTGTFSSTSSAYDLNNYHTSLTLLATTVVNGGSGTVTLTIDGSKKGFNADSLGFVSTGNVSQLNGSRYVRFKVDINNTNPTTPISLDDATLTYSTGAASSFNFSGGCGSIADYKASNHQPRNSHTGVLKILLFMMMPIFILFWIRFRNKNYQTIPRSKPN